MFASRTNWRLDANRFTHALEKHRRGGKTPLDLTASNPTTCGFSYPEREILAALADPAALEYRPQSKGLLVAREAIAAYYRGRAGFVRGEHVATPKYTGGNTRVYSDDSAQIDPERILLTSGTSEAYSFIFRLLCDPGDEILVPAPSYPLFEFLADLADVNLVHYPLFYDHGWQIDMSVLRAALTPRSRAVLVVHPNNPTGSYVKRAEALELTELCASRDIALVADEVFLDYAAGPPRPTFAWSSPALTFTLSGISKISALPQMKIAWLVACGPDSSVHAALQRLEIIADTYLSPSTPVQLALPEFLALRDGMQRQLHRRMDANLAFLHALLPPTGSVTPLDREGGWYVILRVPRSSPDEIVAVELLEHCSVLVHPGQFYDFAEDGFLVLSLITPEADFHEGLRRIHAFFAASGC